MDKKFSALFGNISVDKKVEAQKEHEAKQQRKAQSQFQCRIPDWTGQGGMVNFWINEDGSFESDDNRLDDAKLRDGVHAFARDW